MPFLPALPTSLRAGRRPPARYGLVLLCSAAAFALAACGNGNATPAGSSGPAPSKPAQAGPATPPGAFGTVAAVAATNIEVQNKTSGQVTVNFGSSTTFTNQVSATLADVTVGSCVVVAGTGGNGQPVDARTVSITPATASGCTPGGSRRGAGGGKGTRPSGTNRPRPTGTNGARFSGAFGTVSAVNGNTFTVHTAPRGGQTAPADVTVNVSGTTTYTRTESATASALAVGECVAAVGSTDDTGAVTAKSIAISKAGPNGCTFGGGFGRGGFGGGGNG